jgi:hypothetical protein
LGKKQWVALLLIGLLALSGCFSEPKHTFLGGKVDVQYKKVPPEPGGLNFLVFTFHEKGDFEISFSLTEEVPFLPKERVAEREQKLPSSRSVLVEEVPKTEEILLEQVPLGLVVTIKRGEASESFTFSDAWGG